ncbi:hypothetical protein B7R22_16535 [Subtercola boreus]|uniref:HTH arsR-type domain-containing protein n=1 Tax=Subtercola boreus TaxID=120213 RepID=A0A3E0VU76_9MICO|nr:ArsR family transcriptional regulator [Subtercola boreus]RFA12397.1 hypothetical protein B7R22_16535 [Subtercola boreus]
MSADTIALPGMLPSRILAALGITETRLEILRILLSRPETTTAQLIRATGLSMNGVRAHLQALIGCGLVEGRRATHPRGSGPITYWRAAADDIEDLMDQLCRYLLA